MHRLNAGGESLGPGTLRGARQDRDAAGRSQLEHLDDRFERAPVDPSISSAAPAEAGRLALLASPLRSNGDPGNLENAWPDDALLVEETLPR